MKILVVSDLHGQLKILERIDKKLSLGSFDAVFMCGDLCNAGDPNGLLYAGQFFDIITVDHKLKLFVVHGNQESAAVKLFYQHKDVSVHFKEKSLDKYRVVGVGYGDVIPQEPDFAEGKILLTHEPPRAEIIRKMVAVGDLPGAPLAHFAGHLHRFERVFNVGKTILVQVPTAQNFRAVEYHPETNKVNFINL